MWFTLETQYGMKEISSLPIINVAKGETELTGQRKYKISNYGHSGWWGHYTGGLQMVL